jgi:hypothetical protein
MPFAAFSTAMPGCHQAWNQPDSAHHGVVPESGEVFQVPDYL